MRNLSTTFSFINPRLIWRIVLNDDIKEKIKIKKLKILKNRINNIITHSSICDFDLINPSGSSIVYFLGAVVNTKSRHELNTILRFHNNFSYRKYMVSNTECVNKDTSVSIQVFFF